MAGGHSTWSTADELAFIAGLGTHTDKRTPLTKAMWRARYRRSIALRQDWGTLDRATIEAAVMESIR